MRFLFLTMMITGLILSAGTAQAQPALLENPAPASTPAPVTLPDLTPDVLVKTTPSYQTPKATVPEGQSVIAPSQEPWKKPSRLQYKGKSADEIFLSLPYDVQSQILDETYEVNRQCNLYDNYAQFHDCECLGGRYFEERVFNPEDSKDAIVGQISGECASLPGAAGYGYDQCLSGLRYVLVPSRTDDYCRCFANKFAENYVQSPNPSYDNLRSLSTSTNAYCLQTVRSAVRRVE